jgi:hypothetical protein
MFKILKELKITLLRYYVGGAWRIASRWRRRPMTFSSSFFLLEILAWARLASSLGKRQDQLWIN